METIVTLSLSEFKRLEREGELIKALNSGDRLVYYSSYGTYVAFNDTAEARLIRDLKSAIEYRDEVIEKLRAAEQIIEKRQIKKTSFW